MGTAVAIVVWGVELALTVALVGALGITLAFSSEAHKNRMPPFQRRMNFLAFLLTLPPFGVTLRVGYLHFLASRPDDIPLGLWLPVVVGVGCGVASLLVMFVGEKFSHVGAEAHARRILALVRKKAAAGQGEFACQVVAMDPAATAEDMRRCRAYLESKTQVLERRTAFWPFTEGSTGWKTWNPQEVGLSPFRDDHVALAVIRHDQAWFLRTFLESLLSYRPTLPYTEVSVLHGLLSHLNPASGWSLEAIEPLRSTLLPELLRRLEPPPHGHLEGSPEALEGSRGMLTELVNTGPRPHPPVPALDSSPPPGTLGVVHMNGSGALEFWMRATATEGDIGDVYFRHGPGTQGHAQWLAVLGPLEKGQAHWVPPLKAAGRA